MAYQVAVVTKFEWQKAVKDILITPPSNPIKGDRYLISENAINEWATKANQIAEYNNGWNYTLPFFGMIVFILSKNKIYKYINNIWQDAIIAGPKIVSSQNNGRQLTFQDACKVFTCNSTSNETFILPDIDTSYLGYWFQFVKLGSGTLTIQAGVNDKIADSGNGDTIYCDAPDQTYSNLTLLCADMHQWIIISGHGVWTTTVTIP